MHNEFKEAGMGETCRTHEKWQRKYNFFYFLITNQTH